MLAFALTLVVFFILRLVVGKLAIPVAAIGLANAIFTVLFIAIPTVALFQVGRHHWKMGHAGLFVVFGVLAQIGFRALAFGAFSGTDWPAAISITLSQVGLIVWCTGVGAFLACLLKDRNLLLPISIFLAGFDVFLVFAPVGPTQVLMKALPDALPNIALQVPRASTAATTGPVQPFAFVGPADILFMAMFFIALYKFTMRPRETAIWLVPTILVYLLVTAFVGAVPLLVPIGLCVLLVNRACFQMNKEEKMSTGLVAVIALALAIAAFVMPRPPAGPLPGELAPELQELANSPAQAAPDQSRS
jgi:hypothetical protein